MSKGYFWVKSKKKSVRGNFFSKSSSEILTTNYFKKVLKYLQIILWYLGKSIYAK